MLPTSALKAKCHHLAKLESESSERLPAGSDQPQTAASSSQALPESHENRREGTTRPV